MQVPLLSLKVLQSPQDSVHPGVFVYIVDLNISNNSPLIDDENSPFGYPFRPKNIVKEGDFAMGPEVTEDREFNIETNRPGLKRRNVVLKYTQDLGVEFRETWL